MCDLDSDVPNTCTVYVTLVCYHTCFASIDVGWIFIFARLPLYLKRKLTISRCVCSSPAWLIDGMDRIELHIPLVPPSLTGTEVEYLYQQIPGIRVCHSAAVCCGDRIRTGGVAVLLPPGWEILEELELVPGRAVAVKVQDRTCQFLLMSVYIHPERRRHDAEAL